MEINGNQRKSMEIHENPKKPKEINGNGGCSGEDPGVHRVDVAVNQELLLFA